MKITKIKDLRGVSCPMNFVRTKVELASLKAGEVLEVWLDDGAPIKNVPRSAKGEGHSVSEPEPLDDEGFRVFITKKRSPF